MAHADRGTKLRCPSCGAPFYDLNRDPAICPKCRAQYVAAPRAPSRAARGHAKAVIPVPEGTPALEDNETLSADTEHEDDETLLDGEADEDGDELRD